jgi:hypothetical protein
MGADNRRLDKAVVRRGAGLRLEALPEPAPAAARCPAAKAVGDRIPGPKVLRQVAPRRPSPGERQNGLEKQPIRARRRAAGTRFQGGEDGRNVRPRPVSASPTDRHLVSSKTDFLEETYAHVVNSSTRPRYNVANILGLCVLLRLALTRESIGNFAATLGEHNYFVCLQEVAEIAMDRSLIFTQEVRELCNGCVTKLLQG